jgi:hypothetical protein
MCSDSHRLKAVLRDLQEEIMNLDKRKPRHNDPKFRKNPPEPLIYVECKPNYALVKIRVGTSKRKIIHAGNKISVFEKFEEGQNCMGMVDKDPGKIQPTYLKRMRTKDLTEHGLRLRDKKQNYLVLCPRLEE